MKKIQTTWNLSLLYKNEKDPQIGKDLQKIERACGAFEKKYKGKDFTSTPQKLATAYKSIDALNKIINGLSGYFYFQLRTELNGDDSVAGAMVTKIYERFTKAYNKTLFFELAVGKIPKNKQKTFLKSRALADHRYELERMFADAKYRLPEGEEQLIGLLSLPAYSMWVDGQSRVLSQKTVKYKGEDLPLAKAIGNLPYLPLEERRKLNIEIYEAFKSNSQFAEAEYNAFLNYKKILDERRGYAKPYSSSILSYENTEKEIEELVALVTKNYHLAHRFYKLHAKLLKIKKLRTEDLNVKIGKINRKFSFEETLKIVDRALSSVDPQYGKILERYIANGQFDVYPKKGKSGGAFCASQGDLPTYVLLNHSDNFYSVTTLGHEMGHAIHGELSRRQPRQYWHYTLATAETASTFFEQVTMHEVEKLLSEDEQIIMLHARIQEDIVSIFRQIAGFNFETELHERVRREGQLSRTDIANLLAKHLKSYLGPAAEITEDSGYLFVYWSHIRSFFYVYTYAYGQLISRALFEKWKEDPSYAKKIEKFLSAGRSMSPKDIFKSIGIDTTDPKFFEAGLKGIERDIKRLEKLTSAKKGRK